MRNVNRQEPPVLHVSLPQTRMWANVIKLCVRPSVSPSVDILGLGFLFFSGFFLKKNKTSVLYKEL